MKITHYLYNAFLIEESDVKVAIDPGQNLWLFKLESLIPESEWPTITHVVITHGDPDHHWQSDRVAKASGAHVICGKGLTRQVDGQTLVVDPRGRELTSWVQFDKLYPLEVGESVSLDGIQIDAVKTVHGPIAIPILGFKVKRQPFQVNLTDRVLSLNPPGRIQNKKYRPMVPICDTLDGWLPGAMQSEYLVNWRGRKISIIHKSFKSVAARAGMPDIYPYVIRHTMGAELRRRNVPEREAKGIMGHLSEGGHERHYGAYRPDFQGEAANAIDAYCA